MMGPFDVRTTFRSAERAGGAGLVDAALTVCSDFDEHPTSKVPADAARTV